MNRPHNIRHLTRLLYVQMLRLVVKRETLEFEKIILLERTEANRRKERRLQM